MKEIKEFLNQIEKKELRLMMEEILQWILQTFNNLKVEYKWNQPMFTDHGTYIIGFSVSKKHISVGLEAHELEIFKERIINAGYSHGKMIFRISFNQAIDYDLLKDIIDYNIKDKKDVKTFWRK
jgi:uncharacterized protein YdhG (YjbR/CyaY superfamily)